MPSLYNCSLTLVDRALVQLSAVLDKGAAFCAERKLDDTVLTGDRLFADMFTLTRQVQVACDFSKGCAARLSGAEAPKFEDTEKTFEELKARIQKTRDYVATVSADTVNAMDGKTVSVRTREGEVQMDSLKYVQVMVMPNVYFHACTAYNILRHNGVPVGKGDFVGSMS
jgi:uncharacterized protein